MNIKNNAGETVEFEISKLENSLRNSGAGEQSLKRVLETILPKCFDGITPGELYRMAFEELKKISNSVAARYSLKKHCWSWDLRDFILSNGLPEFSKTSATKLKRDN